MIILILINIAIIVYIYLKYYKITENLNNSNEKIDDKDSIIIGYINDGGFNNNFDLILSEIIQLNIKGYIIIEYTKENIDKYNYTIKQNIDISSNKINKYEMLLLNFLFSKKMEITKNELEEKLSNTFSSYNTQFNEIEEILNRHLSEQNIIDEVKQKELNKKTKKYIKISIILIILVSILGALGILKNSLLYMSMYILEIIVSSVLLFKASIYTIKGQKIKYNIEKYKIELENQEFLSGKNTMQQIVLKKEFADSIALHINTQAKRAFIDDKMIKDATKVSKKTIINVLIIFTILILIGLIVSKIAILLPKEAVVWVYIILAITIACVADITLYKKK